MIDLSNGLARTVEAQAEQLAAKDALIAELVAALKYIARSKDPYESCGWAIAKARAAIAKATTP